MSFLEILLVIGAIFIGFKLLKYIWAVFVGILKFIGFLISGIFKLIGYIFARLGKILLFFLVLYLIYRFFSACSAGEFRTPTARIKGLSVGYLTESAYNNGNFSDEDISSKANLAVGAPQYMVIDLTIKTTLKNEGTESLEIRTYLPGNALNMKLESAPTGKFETTSENGGTAVYTYYTILPGKGDKKTIRIILKLDPEMRGTDKFDILITGTEGTKVKGKTHKAVTLRVGS